MQFRSVLLPMLLAAATCGADEVPAGEPMASAAQTGTAQGDAAMAQGDAAQESTKGKTASGDKALSGMSILGNQEAPKSLVIVPWKSSVIGDTLGLAGNLDDARKPVDKEVFMRELAYYEIRSQ